MVNRLKIRTSTVQGPNYASVPVVFLNTSANPYPIPHNTSESDSIEMHNPVEYLSTIAATIL